MMYTYESAQCTVSFGTPCIKRGIKVWKQCFYAVALLSCDVYIRRLATFKKALDKAPDI